MKKEIIFNQSMSADKRNEQTAYLRHNIAQTETGLYPSADFTLLNTERKSGTDLEIKALEGYTFPESDYSNKKKLQLIFQNDDNDLKIYDYDGDSNRVSVSDNEYLCSCSSNDGIFIAVNDRVSKVRRIQWRSQNNNNVEEMDIDNIISLGNNFRPVLMEQKNEHMFFINDNMSDIWACRVINATRNNDNFSNISGMIEEGYWEGSNFKYKEVKMTPYTLSFLGEKLVVMGAEKEDVKIAIFNPKTHLFENIHLEKKSRLLGGSVVDGKIIVVYTKLENTNSGSKGEIVVALYNGSSLQKLNSIKIGNTKVHTKIKQSPVQDVNGKYLYLAITNNKNSSSELFGDYVLKIGNDGSIETVVEAAELKTEVSGHLNKSIELVKYGYDSLVVGTDLDKLEAGNQKLRIYTNENKNKYTTSKYITNFLGQPHNTHQLKKVTIVFEKLLADEELKIFCRTSEKEEFVLIGSHTTETIKENTGVHLTETEKNKIPYQKQVISFSELPNGDSLPQYNEIQFKFELKNGFSIIKAVYDYDYIDKI